MHLEMEIGNEKLADGYHAKFVSPVICCCKFIFLVIVLRCKRLFYFFEYIYYFPQLHYLPSGNYLLNILQPIINYTVNNH